MHDPRPASRGFRAETLLVCRVALGFPTLRWHRPLPAGSRTLRRGMCLPDGNGREVFFPTGTRAPGTFSILFRFDVLWVAAIAMNSASIERTKTGWNEAV